MKKIIIKKSKDGKYYVVYQQANGEIISVTEMLDSTKACLVNIKSHLSFFGMPMSLQDEFIRLTCYNDTNEYIPWIDL